MPVHATIVDLKLCDGIDPNDLWIARLGHSDGLISTISLKFVPYIRQIQVLVLLYSKLILYRICLGMYVYEFLFDRFQKEGSGMTVI